MSWDDLSKNKMPWPSVEDVHAYRKEVYSTVTKVISSLTNEQCENLTQNSPLWALVMGFEHERIHLETSSYLISELPIKYVQHPAHFPPYHESIKQSTDEKTFTPIRSIHYPENSMITVPKSTVTIGIQ